MYNSSQSSFPPQFVLESEKTEEWANQWVNAVVAYMSYVESPYKNSRLNDIQNYNIYNGTLDLEDFKYITEQYGMAYPARLVNYPIISPKIDLLVGEDLRRPLDVKVSTTNKEAVLRKEDVKVNLIMKKCRCICCSFVYIKSSKILLVLNYLRLQKWKCQKI